MNWDLPTEQDLDIFVALGVLTFRNDFAKTVTFTGREIARILDIGTVHGKFYKRLKLAMDRFIPLRFRALMENEQHEEVKWCNVFQEASFSLNRTTGRCMGSVTWTDKLIQSMDSGFFRLMDANRYMELDGITAKHLYRFLAVAFAKTDVLIIDARQLSTEHLGILNPPKYLSRLMQTLEPAFEQLNRIQVLGSYQIVSSDDWRIALHKHAGYVSERKTLLQHGAMADPEARRAQCQERLQQAGLSAKAARLSIARRQFPRWISMVWSAVRGCCPACSKKKSCPMWRSVSCADALDAGPCTRTGRRSAGLVRNRFARLPAEEAEPGRT